MIQENEVLALIFFIGLLFFIFINRKILKGIFAKKMLVGLLFFMFLARVTTVLEGVLWSEALNITEHISLVLVSVFFLLWLIKASSEAKNAKQ